MYQEIQYERSGPAAIIRLNRPDAHNAYTAVMGSELTHALEAANANDEVRAIILTGTGRHFCVGADLSAGADSFDTSEGGAGAKNFGHGKSTGGHNRAGFTGALYASNKPTIAAFNGSAVGVGLTMTLPTDFKYAADTAKFGFVFTRRGLPPEAGAAWFLPKLVGMKQALDWCLTGNVFSAEEAKSGGLLNDVVPAESLMDVAMAKVTEIAENTAPVSIAVARRLLWQFGPQDNPFDLLKYDGKLAMELGASNDVKEGVSAFLEKRSPAFPGKVSEDLPPSLPNLHSTTR